MNLSLSRFTESEQIHSFSSHFFTRLLSVNQTDKEQTAQNIDKQQKKEEFRGLFQF